MSARTRCPSCGLLVYPAEGVTVDLPSGQQHHISADDLRTAERRMLFTAAAQTARVVDTNSRRHLVLDVELITDDSGGEDYLLVTIED